MKEPRQLVLLTIPASHYCEKARWALERVGLPYREEGHVPIFSRLAGARRGVWSSVPVLLTPEGPRADSSVILRYVDGEARTPREARLYPDEPAARREVEALEAEFDQQLGPHTRRLVYFHLLPDARLTIEFLNPGVPAHEARLLPLVFPAMRRLMRRGMRIDQAGMERSLGRIDEVLGRVAERLGDGRRYLTGERFTAADLSFAALGAPLVLPTSYGGPLPAYETLPAPLRALIEGYRRTSAGAFILRLYDEQRRQVFRA